MKDSEIRTIIEELRIHGLVYTDIESLRKGFNSIVRTEG